MEGRILRADDQLVGLSIGEELTPNTYVVHYEKAARELHGAYQTLCREFARTVRDRYRWIDREQDMAIDGLRVAKESWFPSRLEPAFTLTLGAAACTGPSADA